MRWDYPDGGGSVEAELLRSADWMIAHSVPPVGQSMRLDLPEMGAEGDAIVTAIEACPEIAIGRGRLVVSRFRHSHGEVYDLRLVGSDAIIGVTAHHPLWSATRGAWVSAAELEPGERLSGIGEGAGVVVAVASLLQRGQEPVYNIEVDGDHCYRVGEQGLLVHNASAPAPCTFRASPTPPRRRLHSKSTDLLMGWADLPGFVLDLTSGQFLKVGLTLLLIRPAGIRELTCCIRIRLHGDTCWLKILAVLVINIRISLRYANVQPICR
nr:polymorphic toxin-type HINT domain-containing protein [Tuwongella immobilis]